MSVSFFCEDSKIAPSSAVGKKGHDGTRSDTAGHESGTRPDGSDTARHCRTGRTQPRGVDRSVERNKSLIRCGKYLTNKLIWVNQHHSLIMFTCVALKDNVVDNYRVMFESRISARATEKSPSRGKLSISTWSHDMEGHAKKSVERYCELTNKTTQQLYKVSTPCIDDHHFNEEELKSVEELSNVCSQIVLKCLYLARIGRSEILWSVNKLARAITTWTRACDKRLVRLISYIHFTSEFKQYCHVGNTAQQCTLGL